VRGDAPTLHELSHNAARRPWLFRALDPADALAEMTCGLVMVLTILCTAGWYVEGSDEPRRALALAAFGCCLAWGIIDGFLYVASAVYERGRRGRLIRSVQDSDHATAIEFVRGRVDDATGNLLSAASSAAVAEELVGAAATVDPPTRITTKRADFPPVVGSMVLNVSATVLPGIAILLVNDWRDALAIAKALVVAMLFLTGFLWGRTTRFGAWRSGLAMLLFGLAMVAIAVLFGG
jgi:VIT1/CCC1 family predicted Fe2+/Mn2+ transporter